MNETSMPFQGNDDMGGDWPTPPPEAPAILISTKNRRSGSIGKIAAAMAKAQGAMKGALKDSANPFFKSKYADLASVWSDCRQPLAENEIAVFQMPTADGKKVSVTTLLAHSSDQWLENELTMESKDPSPQGIGSAISYARRYALASMTGVYQTDDDGEQAHGRQGPSQDEVRALADRLREAFKADIDGKMLEVHEEANKDKEAYETAWALLPSNVRSRIKLGIDRAKAAREGREYIPPQPRGPKAA